VNVIDLATDPLWYGLKLFSRDFQYQPQGAPPSAARGFMRRLNPQELQAAAIQQGWLLVMEAPMFVTVTGQPTPRRFDRVISPNGQRYAIETWEGVPGIGPYIYFKANLLGSEQ
jgi:hypothetical protein